MKQIRGASKIVFWAAGEKGGEIVEFKAGGITGKRSQYSFEVSLGRVALSKEWKQYEIPLRSSTKAPLSILGAFAWVAEANANGAVTFYVDDIRYQ